MSRPVMGSEYDVPEVHAILDELEQSKAATQKWYDEAHEKRRELRNLEEQLETLRVVLETAYHYYPKDTPMSDSMKDALGESNPASSPKGDV